MPVLPEDSNLFTGFLKFYFKNSSFHIFISEFPNFIKKLMTEDPNMYDEIKYDFRTGKYNIQIEEEIINFIVSI